MASSSTGLVRKSSQRDKRKSGIYADIQAASPSAPKPTTSERKEFWLVVCGITRPKDSFLLSDWMGYCALLLQRKPPVTGTFYACVDMNQVWTNFSHQSPIITSIKFGAKDTGNGTQKPLFEYTRVQDVSTGGRFWEHVPPESLRDRIIQWIVEMSSKAQPGDIVNVIIEGHGSSSLGGIRVGTELFSAADLANNFAKFVEGVQLNAITGACNSGCFPILVEVQGQKDRYIASATPLQGSAMSFVRSISNRIRCSKFPEAFVRSLATIMLPDTPQFNPHWKMGQHEEFMKEATYRSVSRAADDTTDQYTSYRQPDDLTATVKSIIIRDKADIIFDPAVAASRARIEMPTLNEDVLRWYSVEHTSNPQGAGVSKEDLYGLVSELMSKCDDDAIFPENVPLYDEWGQGNRQPNFAGELLKLLYWRGRLQLAIFDVFEILISRGYLSYEALRHPVDLTTVPEDVAALTGLLECFHGLQATYLQSQQCSYYLEFPLAVRWLAVMILREGADLQGILSNIAYCRMFGRVDPQKSTEWETRWPGYVFKIRSDTNKVKSGQPNMFSFMLPHGVDTTNPDRVAASIRDFKHLFNRIEALFRGWFKVPEDELYLEHEQARHFERYPKRVPGSKYSGYYHR